MRYTFFIIKTDKPYLIMLKEFSKDITVKQIPYMVEQRIFDSYF